MQLKAERGEPDRSASRSERKGRQVFHDPLRPWRTWREASSRIVSNEIRTQLLSRNDLNEPQIDTNKHE